MMGQYVAMGVVTHISTMAHICNC